MEPGVVRPEVGSDAEAGALFGLRRRRRVLRVRRSSAYALRVGESDEGARSSSPVSRGGVTLSASSWLRPEDPDCKGDGVVGARSWSESDGDPEECLEPPGEESERVASYNSPLGIGA